MTSKNRRLFAERPFLTVNGAQSSVHEISTKSLLRCCVVPKKMNPCARRTKRRKQMTASSSSYLDLCVFFVRFDLNNRQTQPFRPSARQTHHRHHSRHLLISERLKSAFSSCTRPRKSR